MGKVVSVGKQGRSWDCLREEGSLGKKSSGSLRLLILTKLNLVLGQLRRGRARWEPSWFSSESYLRGKSAAFIAKSWSLSISQLFYYRTKVHYRQHIMAPGGTLWHQAAHYGKAGPKRLLPCGKRAAIRCLIAVAGFRIQFWNLGGSMLTLNNAAKIRFKQIQKTEDQSIVGRQLIAVAGGGIA